MSGGWSAVAVAAAAMVVAATTALAPGCSIDTRSGDYRCDNGTCKDATRTCIDEWCVLANDVDAAVDARIDGPAVCPAVCTSCFGNTCIIRCTAAASCAERVLCPTGMNCDVACTGQGSCGAGVWCLGEGQCDITCSGTGTCDGLVRCGSGECHVACTGAGSCGEGIDCSGACACDTECHTAACEKDIECPDGAPAACMVGDACSSAPTGCDQC